MALQTILEMIKGKLPFLPNDNSMDAKLENFKLEQFYYLQKWTLKIDADVEDESNYSGLQKMLVSELVIVEALNRKVLENVGGTNGSAPTAGKRLKKGKADVVEAEFDYGKASEGTFLGKTADQLTTEHAEKACEYAATLGYSLPMCAKLGLCVAYDTPAFIVFENPNNCSCG